MVFQYGNMWSTYGDVDLFLVTCNSYVTRDGAVVMGRGIARVARDTFAGVDKDFGAKIEHLGDYGVLLHPEYPANKLALFQVKRHFANNAKLSLIKRATNELCNIVRTLGLDVVALNYPGIGNGGLSFNSVRPIIEALPDSVNVWQFGKEQWQVGKV